jgi:hypothetical protein
MRKVNKKLFVILLPALLVFSCGSNGGSSADLQDIVKEVNQRCPQMLDSETRIDAIEMKAQNTLVYKYSLINATAQQVDTQQFRLAMWPGILSIVKTNAYLEKIRENKTTVEYQYADKVGKTIYTFTITPRDYDQN